MALGSVVTALNAPNQSYDSVCPISVTAPWQNVIDAGGMDDQDAATITNPTTQITASTRHIYQRKGAGTNLILRLVYDDALTAITDPVVKVFGRANGSEVWQLLKNGASGITTTITTQASDDGATDVTDGTYLYTTPDFATQAIDCLGCDEILVGVQTILAGTGTVTTAYLQAKII